MKEQILKIVKESPKSYHKLIMKDPELSNWVMDNTLVDLDSIPAKIYSAVYQESDDCPNGNKKKYDRWSTGFVGCGPAKTCECTRENIKKNTSISKRNVSRKDVEKQNKKRAETMMEKYGVAFNLQRTEVKEKLSKPKVTPEIDALISNKEWIHEEYVVKQRTSVDIAKELGVDYSTILSRCSKFGFDIRQRCRYSLVELDVLEYIRSIYDDIVIHSDRTQISPYELDIYIPDLKLAIEIDGLYWHSWHSDMNISENNKRHIDKTKLCRAQGIDLIHITDEEWRTNPNIIKSIIRNRLGLSDHKIYARKCEIRSVTGADAKKFFDANHVSGYIPASHHIGLYYNEIPVQMISVGRNRFDKSNASNTYELYRMAPALNTNVVGGFSKLIQHLRSVLGIGFALITYTDLMKFNGAGYEAVGFTFVSETGPGFFWTNGTDKISRQKCQRQNLVKWLPTFNPDLSAAENMFNAGYRRFWDCGNKKYQLIL